LINNATNYLSISNVVKSGMKKSRKNKTVHTLSYVLKSKKPYTREFLNKMKQSERDLKAGRTTQIRPADILNF
jgi:predicted HAD superfamily phosphohydrolase YqeG